jgi:quercetin dioxygenase-like cupin family protein
MKTRNVTDLVYFNEDAARTEVLHETAQLFSQVICLQESQGVGPMSDPAADGLVIVLSGEVAAQVGRGRARLQRWESLTVAAGDELSIRNASEEPSVVLLVLAPPPA